VVPDLGFLSECHASNLDFLLFVSEVEKLELLLDLEEPGRQVLILTTGESLKIGDLETCWERTSLAPMRRSGRLGGESS